MAEFSNSGIISDSLAKPRPDSSIRPQWFAQIQLLGRRVKRWHPALANMPLWASNCSEVRELMDRLTLELSALEELVIGLGDRDDPADPIVLEVDHRITDLSVAAELLDEKFVRSAYENRAIC